jgi:4a-hydroxytetrahydrobiopterin dehydratase
MSLKDKSCSELPKGSPALDEAAVKQGLAELQGWSVSPPAGKQPSELRRSFQFEDFVGSIAFVDRMAALAEAEQHHPDFCVHYSRVDVTLSTHSVGGLSENDFILAAKLDAIFS